MGQLMSQKWMILSHRRWARCHGYVKFMAEGLDAERKPPRHENERRRHWYRGFDPSGGGVFGKSQLCSVLSLCHSCKAPLKFSLYCIELFPHLKREKKHGNLCVKGERILIKACDFDNCVMGFAFNVWVVVISHIVFCLFTVWRQKCLTRELSLVLGKRSEICPSLLCCQPGGHCYALYKSSGE